MFTHAIAKPKAQPGVSLAPLRNGVLQRKLTINEPGDRYEQEADQMAEQVMRMPDPGRSIQKKSDETAIQRKCAKCEEEEKKLHRKESSGSVSGQNAPPIVDEVLQSPGQPLGRETRSFMEPRFGYDFGNVRIHTDNRAADSARAVNALAYTVGSDMVFGSGQYQPSSHGGRQLMAHELTHVVQQNGISIGLQTRNILQRVSPIEAQNRAFDAAINMIGYLGENVLFDFWKGDCRDNDKNGAVDGYLPTAVKTNDRKETHSADGDHYSGTYPGFSTYAGLIFPGGEGGNVTTVDFDTSTPVKYRVCADMVSKAYHDASVPIAKTRRVRDIVHFFKTNRDCIFWEISAFTGMYLPGDFICSYDPKEEHGHAGVVVGPGTPPEVVHLPGQSQHIARGVYDPTRLSDMTREPWPSNRQVYGIGRFIGRPH